MKKELLMVALCVGMVAMIGCTPKKAKSDGDGKSDVVEVLYFHGSQRCVTCMAVEELTKAVLEGQFSEQMQEDRLHFRTIDLIEQEEIANEYEVAWSSLLLVDYDSEGNRRIVDLTDTAFLNARTSPERLEDEITRQLTEMLNN